jgi:sortase A
VPESATSSKLALLANLEGEPGDSGTASADAPEDLASRAAQDRAAQDRGAQDRGAQPRKRSGSVALNLAVLTAGLGLLVVGFFAYLFGFTSVEQFHSQHALQEQLNGPAGLAALLGKTPPEGQAVAIAQIPSLGLRQVVVEGTNSEDLENGPGLLIGCAPPGTAGTVVMAGRRSTFGAPFGHLSALSKGDQIILTGALGKFTYVVTRSEIVRPGSPLPASPTTAARLTLVTSTPGLEATSLLVVTADLVGKPVASVPLTAAAVPPASFGLSGDGAAMTPAILWGEGLLAVLLGAWYLIRRTRRTWLVYGLTVPVVIALALLCFANVAALLPATL